MERRMGLCQQWGGNGSVTEETVYRANPRKDTEAWTWVGGLLWESVRERARGWDYFFPYVTHFYLHLTKIR